MTKRLTTDLDRRAAAASPPEPELRLRRGLLAEAAPRHRHGDRSENHGHD